MPIRISLGKKLSYHQVSDCLDYISSLDNVTALDLAAKLIVTGSCLWHTHITKRAIITLPQSFYGKEALKHYRAQLIKKVADIIKNSKTIKHFDLRHNNLTTDELYVLIEAAHSNQHDVIATINVESNLILFNEKLTSSILRSSIKFLFANNNYSERAKELLYFHFPEYAVKKFSLPSIMQPSK